MLKKLALITLIISGLGLALYLGNQDSQQSVEEYQGKALYPQLNTENLKTIIISGGSEAVELSQQEGQWQVVKENFPANADKVKELLVELVDTKIADLISRNDKQHERFQVLTQEENGGTFAEEKTGTEIKLIGKQDETLFHLVLGKERAKGEGQYIRFGGKPEVFVIGKNLFVDTATMDWLNKTFIDLDGKKLFKNLTLQRHDGTTLSFSRENEDADWSLQGLAANEKLKSSPLNILVNNFKNFEFESLKPADTKPEQAGREKLAELKVELFDGRALAMSLGEDAYADDLYHYASVSMSLPDGQGDEALQQQVAEFNQLAQGRLFGFDGYNARKILKERKDFVETVTVEDQPEAGQDMQSTDEDASSLPETATESISTE